MLQKCSNIVSDLIGPSFESQTSCTKDERATAQSTGQCFPYWTSSTEAVNTSSVLSGQVKINSLSLERSNLTLTIPAWITTGSEPLRRTETKSSSLSSDSATYSSSSSWSPSPPTSPPDTLTFDVLTSLKSRFDPVWRNNKPSGETGRNLSTMER